MGSTTETNLKLKAQSSFNLADSVAKELYRMRQEKEENRMAVPNGIFAFIDTDCFRNFLIALLEYCRELFRLENKQAVLEAEAKQRGF